MKGKSKPLLHGVDWAVQAGAAADIMAETRRRVARRKRQRLATAGSVVCLVALAGLFWFTPDRPADFAGEPSSAVVTLPDKRVLPDGSVVEMRSGADIAVEFEAGATGPRRVRLLAGEALFQVAKDQNRPFIVSASGIEFRAVGTSFSVQIDERQVELLVTEGTVAVATKPETGEARDADLHAQVSGTLVTAGNRLVVDVGETAVVPQAESVTAGEMTRQLAWRIPRLEFTQTPLSEALPMINAHSRTRLILEDPALRQVRISGILRADNIETLLRLLAAEHGLTAEPRADGAIILRAQK